MQSITDPVINRLELDNKMNADAHLRPYQTYSHVCSIFIVLSWTNLISAKKMDCSTNRKSHWGLQWQWCGGEIDNGKVKPKLITFKKT